MFDKVAQRFGKKTNDPSPPSENDTHFNFVANDDSYVYPSLYEEADSMLQVSLLIYTITDLRSLAKRKNSKLKDPERMLSLPLKFSTCLECIAQSIDIIKKEFGDDDHAMTMSALQSIQERYDQCAASSSQNKNQWWNPFTSSTQGTNEAGVEVQPLSPFLVAYGDENPDTDLVYAVGVDPIKKRVTVAFRGSVTPADFLKDASISLNHQPNPLKDIMENKDTLGLHHGFYEYLLKPRKNGETKYEEILKHVQKIFEEDPTKQKEYKLYVTGHSLGGALATLFSFHVAALALTTTNSTTTPIIPMPVTCVSVASPRVGDKSFQQAFQLCEQRGALRHLRMANEKDPVTLMPKSTSKKIWSMLSPVSYLAFKMADQNFEDKETYHHTGMKLKLRKPGLEDTTQQKLHVIGYSGAPKEQQQEETADADADKNSTSSKWLSFKEKDIPDVVLHFGNSYAENLAGVKEELTTLGLTLNELYKEKAVAAVVLESS